MGAKNTKNKRNYTKNYRKNRHNKTRRHQTGGSVNKKTANKRVSGSTDVYLIHSAGCIHCIQMKPEWEKFVKEFENKGGIQIRDIEASSDDFKKIKEIVGPIEGFPTILKKKGNNDPVTYTGRRTAAEFGEWAQQ